MAFGLARQVSTNTPMVTFEHGQYSVPQQLLGRQVWVRAQGVGANGQVIIVHIDPRRGPVEVARQVFAAGGLRLVELRLADHPSLEWQRLRAVVREGVRARLPVGAVRKLKRLLGR